MRLSDWPSTFCLLKWEHVAPPCPQLFKYSVLVWGLGPCPSPFPLLAVPCVWWAFYSQWMDFFVIGSLLRWTGVCAWSRSWWMGHAGEARAPLQTRLPHPDRAGHVLLGPGSPRSIPVKDRTSLLLSPSQELLSPRMTAKANPQKPRGPSMSHLPVALPHTLRAPRKGVRTGGESASQVSNHRSRKAEATGKDPWQLCLLGRIGTWPELTLHYVTAKRLWARTVNVRMTLGLRTDGRIKGC